MLVFCVAQIARHKITEMHRDNNKNGSILWFHPPQNIHFVFVADSNFRNEWEIVISGEESENGYLWCTA